MVDSLLPQLLNQFMPTIEDSISQKLGIDKQTVHQALLVAIPFILGAVAKKMSSPGGASDISKILQQANPAAGQAPIGSAPPAGQAPVESAPAASAASDQGNVMVRSIFGDSAPQIGKAISDQTGVDGGQVLSLATPAVMNSLSQFQQAQGLDHAGLAKVLNQHTQVIGRDNPEVMAVLNNALKPQPSGGLLGAIKRLFGL